MKNIREEIQIQSVEHFLDGCKKSILLVAPRVGKIRISLEIIEREKAKHILVVYPRNDIQKGWLDEIELLEKQHLQVEYSTAHSLKKLIGRHYDYIILDEIHEFSDAQLDVADKLIESTPTIALTGTATATTLKNIEKRTGLSPCFEYTIEEAVRDGILCDYEINVYLVELDDKTPMYESKKGKKYTEKRWMGISEFLRKKTKNYAFFDNKIIGIIQNSVAKLRKTKAVLRDSGDERVLVFCGTTKIADSLDIPVYHSGNKDGETLRQFCEGEIPKVATCKMFQAGIKIIPIHRALFNFVTGAPEETAQKISRVLAIEWLSPNKKALIDIIISNTAHEKSRISTTLNFFDKTKVKWIN